MDDAVTFRYSNLSMKYNVNESMENVTILYQTQTDTASAVITPTCEIASQIEIIVMGYLSLLIIVLGMIGNSLSIVVLTRKAMHTSTNCYLLALAIWDTLVIICTLLLMTFPSLSPEFKNHVMPYVVVIMYPLAPTAQMSTLWLTVSFTVERYIAVCHPLQAARMCTVARARVVIVAVSVASILFNLSRWFEYRLNFCDPSEFNNNQSSLSYEQTDLCDLSKFNNNQSRISYEQTEFGKNNDYKQVYFFWFYLLIMFIVPITSLSVLNIFLILAVRQSQIQRKDMNVRQSRENNVTIMLVSIIIVFIICQIPALIYNLAWSIDIDTVQTQCGWNVLSIFRNFMVTLNSCVNFILYCALGQRFRHTCIRSFCRCLIWTEDGHSFRYVNSAMMASSSVNTYAKYRLVCAKRGLLTFRMENMAPSSGLGRRSTMQTSELPTKSSMKTSKTDGSGGLVQSVRSPSLTANRSHAHKECLLDDLSDTQKSI